MIDRNIFRFSVRAAAILIVAFGTSGFGGVESLFAPKASLWEKWTAHTANSATRVDHSLWNWFLSNYVTAHPDGVTRVAYGNVDETGRNTLDSYVKNLTAVPVDLLSRDEQMAYWINLYNALTVKVVLTHYPVDSIRDIDISPGLFSDGPWDKKLVEVGGEPVSLNDIEHRILRPIWDDPRIHYAVNCASIGCPNLQRTAFTGAELDSMLDKTAREYINDRRGIDPQGERVVLSSIYAWFTKDFGGDLSGVIAHLKQYASAELADALDDAAEIEDAYDWSLNDLRTN